MYGLGWLDEACVSIFDKDLDKKGKVKEGKRDDLR